ncbi:MAG: hypothetical protein V4495_12075 [Pseudomonadota bacterium]
MNQRQKSVHFITLQDTTELLDLLTRLKKYTFVDLAYEPSKKFF